MSMGKIRPRNISIEGKVKQADGTSASAELLRGYFAPKGLGWVQRLTSGQSAFMMRIANEQPSG